MIILELLEEMAGLLWYDAYLIAVDDTIWHDYFFVVSDFHNRYNFHIRVS